MAMGSPSMAIRPLVYFPLPMLRQVAAPVADVRGEPIQKLARDLGATMLAANGIGLAAPQIGVGKRVIVVRMDDGFASFINPEVTDYSEHQEDGEEGCLSIPGVFGLVRRAYQAKIKGVSPTGEVVTLDADGLLARILQHEIDHLNGILFIDRWHKVTSGAERLRQHWDAYRPPLVSG